MRATAVVVALLAVSVAACGVGDDGDPAEPQPTVTVTVTETVTPQEPEATPTPTATEDASPDVDAGEACAEIEPIGAQLAFIVVSSPAPGTVLESGATVTGCGNTFEASYQWELLDGQGAVLASDAGTMTCGNGCHGTFEFTVDYAVTEEQIGTLRVFESSAQDGSEVHVNAIPVRLQP